MDLLCLWRGVLILQKNLADCDLSPGMIAELNHASINMAQSMSRRCGESIAQVDGQINGCRDRLSALNTKQEAKLSNESIREHSDDYQNGTPYRQIDNLLESLQGPLFASGRLSGNGAKRGANSNNAKLSTTYATTKTPT